MMLNLFPLPKARAIPGAIFWLEVKCNDADAYEIFKRHYTFNPRANHVAAGGRFIGPGEPLALISEEGDAIFGWRKFIDDSGQVGVNCCYFRNEGHHLSSRMILEAEEIAWRKWPMERLYTYVNDDCILSPNPGYCFKCAGWRQCGLTKGGLIILEKTPERILDSIPSNPTTDKPSPSLTDSQETPNIAPNIDGGGHASSKRLKTESVEGLAVSADRGDGLAGKTGSTGESLDRVLDSKAPRPTEGQRERGQQA